MAPRRSAGGLPLAVLAVCCALAGFRLAVGPAAFLHGRPASEGSPEIGRGALRAALLPAWVAGAPLAAQGEAGLKLPTAEGVDKSNPQYAIYRGKASVLRSGTEWWRLNVGDLIEKGSGEGTADGYAASDTDCAAGMCSAGIALNQVKGYLAQGLSKGGGIPTPSRIEEVIITPMFAVADIGDLGILDPDSDIADDLKKQAQEFRSTCAKLGKTISKTPGDQETISALYTDSLKQINKYSAIANAGFGADNTQDWFLPQLPLSKKMMDDDPYWQQQRQIYEEDNDPGKLFRERNAIGSKDLRENLRRFPGATLLLR